MSATELFEQVKQELKNLPADERERFFDRVMALEQDLPVAQPVGAAPLDWPDVQARHRRTFGDQVLPLNIVLAARDEELH